MKQLPSLSSINFLSKFNVQKGICIAQGIKSILSQKFDFDVYLPTRGMNLQRGFVWSLQQKQALIESIMVGRPIPTISAIYTNDDIYQVIDGKQRLSTIISYLKDEFEYCGYYYKDLPREYILQIGRYWICCDRLLEYDIKITDDEKIEWFTWINFSGTIQDVEHFNKLKKG
jgi:hypothetical protein